MEATVKQPKPQNSIWHSVTETVDEILDRVPDYLDMYLSTQLTQGTGGTGQKTKKSEPSVEVKTIEGGNNNMKTLLIVLAGMLGVALIAKGK